MKYKGKEIGTPTIDMVREYIENKGFNLSAEKVFNRYATNGWKTTKGTEVNTLEAAVNGCNSAKKKYLPTSEEKREEYKSLLQTQEWQDYRKAVIAYYGSKCQKCGATDNLHVHHNAYQKSAAILPWGYYYKDLQVLCEKCHNEEHDVKITNKV